MCEKLSPRQLGKQEEKSQYCAGDRRSPHRRSEQKINPRREYINPARVPGEGFLRGSAALQCLFFIPGDCEEGHPSVAIIHQERIGLSV